MPSWCNARWPTLVLLALLAGCATRPAPDAAEQLIRRAEAALGSAQMSTISFRGRGQGVALGQAQEPGLPGPPMQMRVFSRAMHFDDRAFREEFIQRPAAEAPDGPPARERRGVVLARQAFSWDVVDIAVAPEQTSWVSRMHDLWLSTPQGAVKAAERHGAQAGRQRVGWQRLDTLSYQVPGQFSATVLLDEQGRVVRVDSVLPEPLLGDVAVRTEFSDYRSFGTLPFPQRIVQHKDGLKVLDLEITHATLNPALEITVPENVRTSGNAPAVEWLADGLWVLAGGTHHSVLIEQADQLVMVEAPLDDERGRALVAAARRLAGDKPMGAVVVTHHHLDHVGGLRVLAATGATVYSSPAARPWLQAAMQRPLTRRTDPLAERDDAARPPQVQAVAERLLLPDAERPVEVHAIRGTAHAAGMLMVWLPRQQVLVQVDAWTPAPPGQPQATPDPQGLNLLQNLQRLGIQPQRIVPLHGRVISGAEMMRQLVRTGVR